MPTPVNFKLQELSRVLDKSEVSTEQRKLCPPLYSLQYMPYRKNYQELLEKSEV